MVLGPLWTEPGLGRYAGRYPLAVERHLMGQIDRLLPGVTTVTPHGRYYAVHGLVADEAANLNLSDLDAQDLLRRVEVVIAAVSIAHQDHPQHEALNRPHGADAIAPGVASGEVDVLQAAGQGARRYAKAPWGYLGPYQAAEMTLGILDTDRFGPGPKFNRTDVGSALGELLSLARRKTLTTVQLEANAHLCICGGAAASDGRWLTDLLIPQDVKSPRTRAATRRATIHMFTRAMELQPVRNITGDISGIVTFGPASRDDPVLADIGVTGAWQGVILRWYSVTAWRQLWAWLVSGIDGLTHRTALGDRLADALPYVTVGRFLRGLPRLDEPDGVFAPAEQEPDFWQESTPVSALAILALGAQRSHSLADPDVLAGFHGTQSQEISQELGPRWMMQQLTRWSDKSLQDFARYLSEVLINRSQRISYTKARLDKATGELKVPTRVFLRDNWIFKDSEEGSGAVGLRWEQLATVLTEAGVVRCDSGLWSVTDRGHHALA